MKAFLRSSSFLLIFLILILALFNISNIISIETSFLSLKVNIGFLILLCAVGSSLATLMLAKSFRTPPGTNQKEKLNSEIQSDKVKQLEEKIKTLEEALRMRIK